MMLRMFQDESDRLNRLVMIDNLFLLKRYKMPARSFSGAVLQVMNDRLSSAELKRIPTAHSFFSSFLFSLFLSFPSFLFL